MRVHVLSDLHLEFGGFEPPSGLSADVTVLAGDTWTRARLGMWADAPAAFGRPVIAVAGNHDFWGTGIDDGLIEMRAAADRQRITFLERNSVVIGGVRFLGCTLWTDFRVRAGHDDDLRNRDMARCGWQIGDYGAIAITHNPEYRAFDPKYTARLHAESVTWLDGALSQSFDGQTVVITHHAPSPRCLAPGAIIDPISAAYASDLEPMIRRHKPKLWISGHTHVSVDLKVGSTRLFSNPRGYRRLGANTQFNLRAVVKV